MPRPVDVTTSTIIARPVAEVAQYAGDPYNAPEWYANIQTVEWETQPPMRVGSRLTFVARFLGRTLRYTYEVVEHEPERRLVMRTQQGPFPMETTYTWEPVGDGEGGEGRGVGEGGGGRGGGASDAVAGTDLDATRMALRNRGVPSGFSRLASPFLAAAMRRANRKDLRRLQRILEAR